MSRQSGLRFRRPRPPRLVIEVLEDRWLPSRMGLALPPVAEAPPEEDAPVVVAPPNGARTAEPVMEQPLAVPALPPPTAEPPAPREEPPALPPDPDPTPTQERHAP